MIHGFPELVIGGVLVAPFVTYATVAFILVMLLRPLLHVVRFDQLVSNPPLVVVSIYVLVLAFLIVLF